MDKKFCNITRPLVYSCEAAMQAASSAPVRGEKGGRRGGKRGRRGGTRGEEGREKGEGGEGGGELCNIPSEEVT